MMKRLNESGFTILEMLCAVVVLAIGLMSGAAMQTRAIQQSTFSHQLTKQVLGGEEIMENIIARPIVFSPEPPPPWDPIFAYTSEGYPADGTEVSEHYTDYNVRYQTFGGTPLKMVTTVTVYASRPGTTDASKELNFKFIRSTRWE